MKNINKGFTLAELMVVVGLIAILMTFTLISINKNKVQTRDNLRVSDIQTIRLALEQYRASCGVFPQRLGIEIKNTRTPGGDCNFTLGDFISEIPGPPEYGSSDQVNDQMGPGEYLYVGLSSRRNGPCFDYHIGVQLEDGKGNDYDNGENQKNFRADHDFEANGTEIYRYSCAGSGNLIQGANDDQNGIYDFRSQNSEGLK
jgi:prepilin-type N-terminal cleavage/methylation domain-containing protein